MALAKYKFVGMKHVEGEKDGRKYAFDLGCFTTDWTEREINDNGAKGINAIVPTIPDQWKDVLNVSNLGKEVEMDTYYAKGRINIGYVRMIDKK